MTKVNARHSAYQQGILAALLLLGSMISRPLRLQELRPAFVELAP